MSTSEKGPFSPKKQVLLRSDYDAFLNMEVPDEQMCQDILSIVEHDLDQSDLERLFWTPNELAGKTYNLRRAGRPTEFPMSDYSSKNSFMMWINFGIANLMSHMMTNEHYRTTIIKNTVSGHNFQRAVFTRLGIDNFCRDSSGKLFSKKDLKYFTRFAANARGYLASALIHGDQEALAIAKSFKDNANYQTVPDFIRLAGEMKFKIHPSIHNDSPQSLSPSMYLSKLISLSGQEFTDFISSDFRRDFLVQHGDLIFEHLFKASGCRHDPEFDLFIKQLVEMGVDWYAGLINAMESPVNRLDVSSRTREPVRELFDLFKRRDASRKVSKLILLAQPEGIKAQLCNKQSFANQLFLFTDDQSLMPYLSEKQKRETLSCGLGL